MRSLTRDEVRAIDRWAIEKLGIPGVMLMENAGRNAAEVVRGLLSTAGRRAVAVVAGAGNNGGDGFVIARHLARDGCLVSTFLVAPEAKITGDARINLNILRNIGLAVRCIEPSALGGALEGFDMIVDAVGGTGIRGPLEGDLAVVVDQINQAVARTRATILAVDIPTGLDCDTGLPTGSCIRAARTVTFVARKKGFDNPASRAFTGEVHVADIGINAVLVGRLAGLENL